MKRSTHLVLAFVACAFLSQGQPGLAQSQLLGVKSAAKGELAIQVPMRRMEIGPPPAFGANTTLEAASASDLKLEIRSRYGSSLDYFYYQAEVIAADPKVGARITKVEFVDAWGKTTVLDGVAPYRRVDHTFGTWTLKARVTMSPRFYIPRLNEQTVVELAAKVPNPAVQRPLPDGLRFVETSRYMGNGRHDFSLRLQGAADALANVVEVQYSLHPSFARTTRTASDPANGFALSETSWGPFRISIQILLKDGSVAFAQHDLRLTAPAN